MSEHATLTDDQLKIQANDSLPVRAAKVSLKTGRQLKKADDPEMVKIVTGQRPSTPLGWSTQPTQGRKDVLSKDELRELNRRAKKAQRLATTALEIIALSDIDEKYPALAEDSGQSTGPPKST